jgi:molecular chaperone GrpE
MSETDKTTATGSSGPVPYPNGAGEQRDGAPQEATSTRRAEESSAKGAPSPESPGSQEEGPRVQEPQESPEVERLRSELEAARKRVDELARAFQAMNQDREEFKQRLARERERLLDVERGNVALTLLEAVDELDRCLMASAHDDSPLAQGVRLIREGLLSKLAQTGVQRYELVGQPFDPNLADAADMEITTSPEEDQKVVAEIQAGYKLKDRVIRPARVKVAKYVKPAEA